MGASGATARSSRLAVMRDVARDVWGEDVVASAMDRIDEGTRAALQPNAVLDEWVTTAFVSAWATALFDGPCRGQADAKYLEWTDRVTRLGFGTRGGLFTSLANPVLILRRANELWRLEYSTCKLTSAPLAPDRARLTLRDHPFTELASTRAAMAEAFRYVLVMCGVGWATAAHEIGKNNALHVLLAWGDARGADPRTT